MEPLIGNPTTKGWDKVKNLVFAYAIMVVWVFSITAFLQYLLGVGGQIEAPDEKYTFFMSCIWASFWEELCFRYAPIKIVQVFNTKLLTPVILISSAIFGWAHGFGPISLLIQGVMGFVFACIYLKNGNIIYCMILHSAWNISCMYLFPRIN